MKSKIKIWTDGSSRGNPGPGGYGAVIRYFSESSCKEMECVKEVELSQGYMLTTNNRMELMAAIAALEALEEPSEVIIHSDSKYLVDAHEQGWIKSWIKKGWRTAGKNRVKNVDLWQRLLKAEEPHEMHYVWVAGHAGHELNERCDALAVEAACGLNLLEDRGYIS